MNVKKIPLVALLVLPFLLDSCFTSSFLQTAKPLDKGTAEFTVGATGYARDNEMLPGINTMIRVGVGGRSDIGLAYATGLFGHGRLDYKYNFYRSPDERRFLSSGFGFDYFTESEDGNGVPAINIPLYFSINHPGNVVPYFGQRFTLGVSNLDVLFGNGTGSHNLYYTGAAGIRFGKSRLKGFLEFSYSVRSERYRHISYNAQNEPIQFDNRDQNAGVELNIGLTIPFGGNREK